jgi:hypothetical protein
MAAQISSSRGTEISPLWTRLRPNPRVSTNQDQSTVYRCTACQGIYNLYSRTFFEGRYFRPAQAVLLLRGVVKGDRSAEIAREIGVGRQTVLEA